MRKTAVVQTLRAGQSLGNAIKQSLKGAGRALARRQHTPSPVLTAAATAPADDNASLTAVIDALESLKAENVVTISLRGKSSIADSMIIATGTSSRHLTSLARRVDDALADTGHPVLGREGDGNSDWVCVDAGSLVIHLFLPATRQLYNLEKLWSFPATPSS